MDPDVAVIEPVGGSGDTIVQGDAVNDKTATEGEAGTGEPSKTPSEDPRTSLPDIEIVNENMPDLIGR